MHPSIYNLLGICLVPDVGKICTRRYNTTVYTNCTLSAEINVSSSSYDRAPTVVARYVSGLPTAGPLKHIH